MPPYFIYPDIIALRENPDAPDAELHRRRIAANVGDMPTLRRLLGLDPEEFARFYPDNSKPELSTQDTIDTFLSRFGREDLPLPKAASEIPVQSEEVNAEEKKIPKSPAELIKNHDYEGALERIMQLSLNNPEKSIYFADQIRFLKKLILLKGLES
ncbi:MAG: hypothetical protein K2K58_11880 [Muribaculaceae bacterium]|nr:hypothetical protein [Muribaculaceae bacterium]